MERRMRENRPSFKRKRDNYGRKLRKKKVINYLRGELRTCTTHGLPHIVDPDIHWLERLFWMASFFICVIVIIALLSMQYHRFIVDIDFCGNNFRRQNTPIVTSVERDYFNWNVSYPAITLCPMYQIEDDDLLDLVNETLESTGENVDAYLRIITTISYDMANVVEFDDLDDSEIILAKDYAMLAAMLFKKFDNNSLTTSTNWPISVEIAMTEMGMCHVINSNIAALDNPTKRTTAKYVKNNVDLSVHEREFFVQIINYADLFRVYIHSPDELIQITSPSYTSKSNNYIEFGVRVWSTRISDRLKSEPISVRKCRFLNEPLNERYPVYTHSHCIIECKIKMILKLCGCLPHLYKPMGHERVCNLTELSCFVKHKKAITTLSVSDEILKNFTTWEDLPQSQRDCGCISGCESDKYMKDRENFIPQDNYNSVRVGISSFSKFRIVKDTIINLYDIILRSGGVMNLCLGTSVISLMELILLLIKIVIYFITNIIKSITLRQRQLISCYNNRQKKKLNKKQ